MHNLLQMSDESRAAFVALKEREAPKLAERFSPRDADLFWVRMERYFEDAYFPLIQLYGEHSHRQEHSDAMAVSIPGKGSDYAIAYVDSEKRPFDGSKTYKLNIPANPPVNNFWSVTMYDSQTRSLLQSDQPFPALDSISGKFKKNADGSIDLYILPKAPSGMESNWLQSVPGKSFFVALRMYGPLEPWIKKTWRPSEVEPVK